MGAIRSSAPGDLTPADINRDDRLFTPLESRHYFAFDDGGKTWELRGVNNLFHLESVKLGRSVELRRGYSTDDSIWGIITGIRKFRSVDAIVADFPIEKIRPGTTEEEFRDSVADLLGKYETFIAFEVTTLVNETERSE